MKRQSSSSSSKSSNKKTRHIFNPKSNVIFEDKASKKSIFRMIFDKDEPFYKHTFPTEEE